MSDAQTTLLFIVMILHFFYTIIATGLYVVVNLLIFDNKFGLLGFEFERME